MAMDSYLCILQIPVSWIPEVLVVRKVIHSFIYSTFNWLLSLGLALR